MVRVFLGSPRPTHGNANQGVSSSRVSLIAIAMCCGISCIWIYCDRTGRGAQRDSVPMAGSSSILQANAAALEADVGDTNSTFRGRQTVSALQAEVLSTLSGVVNPSAIIEYVFEL